MQDLFSFKLRKENYSLFQMQQMLENQDKISQFSAHLKQLACSTPETVPSLAQAPTHRLYSSIKMVIKYLKTKDTNSAIFEARESASHQNTAAFSLEDPIIPFSLWLLEEAALRLGTGLVASASQVSSCLTQSSSISRALSDWGVKPWSWKKLHFLFYRDTCYSVNGITRRWQKLPLPSSVEEVIWYNLTSPTFPAKLGEVSQLSKASWSLSAPLQRTVTI